MLDSNYDINFPTENNRYAALSVPVRGQGCLANLLSMIDRGDLESPTYTLTFYIPGGEYLCVSKPKMVKYISLLAEMGLKVSLKNKTAKTGKGVRSYRGGRAAEIPTYAVDIDAAHGSRITTLMAVHALRYLYEDNNAPIIETFLRFVEDGNDPTTLYNRFMMAHFTVNASDHGMRPYYKLYRPLTDATYEKEIIGRGTRSGYPVKDRIPMAPGGINERQVGEIRALIQAQGGSPRGARGLP